MKFISVDMNCPHFSWTLIKVVLFSIFFVTIKWKMYIVYKISYSSNYLIFIYLICLIYIWFVWRESLNNLFCITYLPFYCVYIKSFGSHRLFWNQPRFAECTSHDNDICDIFVWIKHDGRCYITQWLVQYFNYRFLNNNGLPISKFE